MDEFLNLKLSEMYEWIKLSYEMNISGGYEPSISKAMLEQEILFWIDENKINEKIENDLFIFLKNLK